MSQATIDDVVLPKDVVDFCSERGLAGDLHLCISLACEIFSPVRSLTVGLEADPEVDECYVVVDVARTLLVDDALARRREFSTRWVQAASPEARYRIRMLSDIS
jgi:hypothetical protein